MKKLLFKLAILGIVLYLSFTAVNRYYDRQILSYSTEKAYWLLKKHGNTYDYAVTGSSRAESMFDPSLPDSLYHLNGINIGQNGTGLTENCLILQKFIQTNTIKTLLLEVDFYNLNPDIGFPYPFHNFVYLPMLGKDPVADSIFRKNTPYLKYLTWKYLPFTKYIEFSNYYPLFHVIKGNIGTDPSWEWTDKGYRKATPRKRRKLVIRGYMPQNPASKDCFDPAAYQNLLSIIRFCKSKKIKLVLYTGPEYYTYQQEYSECRRVVKGTYTELSQKFKIQFIDYSKDSINYDMSNFNDVSHLNHKGTLRFSDMLLHDAGLIPRDAK